jgi:16S rRNA processing protein RimM
MQVVVGRIGRAHGIRGDVTVDIRTDEPERRFARGAALGTDPADAGPLVVVAARMHSGRLLVRFDQVSDRTGAEKLRGVTLLADVDPADLPSDPDEFYDHQLVGLHVTDVHRGPIGDITEVVHLPGQDSLTVSRNIGPPALIPFVSAIVTSIDIEGGQVTVDVPEGLLELGDDQPGKGSFGGAT